MLVWKTTWWVRDQPRRPMLVMARMMARARRMGFQRYLGSSAYICWREGRRVNMVGEVGMRWR